MVSVGGDGLFAEVVDGLVTRTMKEDGTDLITTDTCLLQPRWRIGIIPAGQSAFVLFDLRLVFIILSLRQRDWSGGHSYTLIER